MNYLQITKCDQLNYDGLRVVLWVSGCSHNCKGCQNSFSQNPLAGVPFDEAAENEIFAELEKDWCTGLTLSGGDPLFSSNREIVINFAKKVKERFPNKTICLYTGYTWDDIINDDTMKDILLYVDTVIDGEYVEAMRSVELPWVGSSNQHIIDVKKRVKTISSIFNVNS
jgi:anaerobic ribonucleoside-triphosphate reductase activating protein